MIAETECASPSDFRRPCELCGDVDGWRGFHRPDCTVGWDSVAFIAVNSEALVRSLGCGDEWAGPWATWRDLADGYEKKGLAAKAKRAAGIRDRIANLKGVAGVKAELEYEMQCRRCEEEALEREVAGVTQTIEGVTGRHGLAHSFGEWLESRQLSPGNRVVVDRDASKRYYRISWKSDTGAVAGEVHIHGPAWIRVKWSGFADWMPVSGSRIFDSEFSAQMFLHAVTITKNWQIASRIPTKPEKGAVT